MRCILVTVVSLFMWTSFGMAQNRPPIIDMHQHAIPADFWGTPDPAWFSETPPRAETDEALMAETLSAMEQFNIVKAAFSGPSPHVDAWHEVAPSRVLRGTNFASSCSEDLVETLRELHEKRGYEIMGEIAWQFSGIRPNSPEVDACFALAEELDVPMGIHLGLGFPGAAYATGFRAEAGRPLLLEEALLRHPNTRVYIMHAGWPLLDETIAVMHNHRQVYADVSLINWLIPRAAFHRYLKRLVEAGLGDRLMYGSDAGVWPEAIALSIEAVESADFLTDQQKRDIFYNNAARFLGFDNEP
ncbi:MAG: amidohydrolase family protein [Gemmatimonadota bacterium]|nr:MAG: amidohydrolase family protein [Gemmatimonadota bacterium]